MGRGVYAVVRGWEGHVFMLLLFLLRAMRR